MLSRVCCVLTFLRFIGKTYKMCYYTHEYAIAINLENASVKPSVKPFFLVRTVY